MVLQRRLNVCVYYATPCTILCEVLSEQCEVLFYGVMGTLYVYYRLTCECKTFSSRLTKTSSFDCQLTFLKMTQPYWCTNQESSNYIIDSMSCSIVCSYLERLALCHVLNVFFMPLSPFTFSSPRPRSSSKLVMLKLVQRW